MEVVQQLPVSVVRAAVAPGRKVCTSVLAGAWAAMLVPVGADLPARDAQPAAASTATRASTRMATRGRRTQDDVPAAPATQDVMRLPRVRKADPLRSIRRSLHGKCCASRPGFI